MKLLILTVLILSGCTISVDDKRVSREELAAAFAQRDAAIGAIIEKLKQLEPKQPTEKKHDSKPR